MDILNQSWSDPMASTKKFFAREIMYQLSKQVDASNFEVVLDGDLDLFNKTDDQPDIVVYQRQHNFSPVLAIELSTKERFHDHSREALTKFNVYGLKEYLIYNLDEDRWYSISGDHSIFSIATKSAVLQVTLGSYVPVKA